MSTLQGPFIQMSTIDTPLDAIEDIAIAALENGVSSVIQTTGGKGWVIDVNDEASLERVMAGLRKEGD